MVQENNTNSYLKSKNDIKTCCYSFIIRMHILKKTAHNISVYDMGDLESNFPLFYNPQKLNFSMLAWLVASLHMVTIPYFIFHVTRKC